MCRGEATSCWRTITWLLLPHPGIKTAVAAVLLAQNLEGEAPPPTCPHCGQRVARQYLQLGIERHRDPGDAREGSGPHQHHGVRTDDEGRVELVAAGGRDLDRVERRLRVLQARHGAQVHRACR